MPGRTLVGATAALLLGAGLAAAQTPQEKPQQPGATAEGETKQTQEMGQTGHGMMMRGDDHHGSMMMGRGMGHGAMRPHMMLMMMAIVDTDGSKTLSLEEVQAVHARIFAYADADGDGELTMDEMRAFMHGQGGMAER